MATSIAGGVSNYKGGMQNLN